MPKFPILLLSVTLASLSIMVVPQKAETIVFEAESFADIVEPMRVVQSDTGTSGNGFVELPLGSGQGWRGKGGGEVTYRIELDKGGEYTLWARTLWQDGCTNAMFMKANKGPQFVLGNDAIFQQWHWVKGQTMTLEKGVNLIKLANHSDGISMDKFVLTNDPLYLPEGLGQGITRFYDGFAGCDGDNTGSWDIRGGNWRVIPSIGESAGGVNDALAQWDPAGGIALGGFTTWKNYDLEVKMMQSSTGKVTLLYFHQDEENEMRLVCDSKDESTEVRLERITNGERSVLASQEFPLSFDHWYTIGLKREDDQLVAYIDEEVIFNIDWPSNQTQGQIGLSTQNTTGVYFDNVEVRFHES